jgi:hypothetical protein
MAVNTAAERRGFTVASREKEQRLRADATR